ncbi:unnamed protein product [Cylindrotheca closterium]|uniref:Orc1-like AAA ATPase domain-containing protein n=1 Tax=Cylindrotheca closterium TaxID=2856 RepID=A0AAD2FXM5_9STRA|nr:unnamed protein product [Cylindrotheca closterium]
MMAKATGRIVNESADLETAKSLKRIQSSPRPQAVPEKNNGSLSFEDGTASTFSNGSKRTIASEAVISHKLDRSSSFTRRVPYLDDDIMRSNAMLQELTINKLRFDSVGLVDREEEMEVLKSSLNRMTSIDANKGSKGNKELVFIEGSSGSGKTELVGAMQAEVSAMNINSMIAEGKFDVNSTSVPYSAIAAAFGKICEGIHHQRLMSNKMLGDPLSTIGRKLVEEIGGDDIQVLTKLIPQLDMILPDDVQLNQRQIMNDSFDLDAVKTKWEYAFRVMTRELSSLYSPLIIVLDDLQWADGSSLNVIDFLMTDTGNENPLMIIGCYRSNEVDESHILNTKQKELESKKQKFKFQISNISLANLDIDGVNKVIMAVLSIDKANRTRGLAEVCFKRSLGNPLFLIEFISMLEEEGLLSFNLGLFEWSWDEKEVERETMSTANVVDLVRSRMKKIPKSAQLVLQFAACLGQTVNLKTLNYLWAKLGNQEDELSNILLRLERGNFFERIGDDSYRWIHIKLKETAMLTGDAAEPAFQFEIGCTLYHEMSSDELEDLLFEVTDLINAAGVERRIEFAELNLRAAEKAKQISAFNSASEYVAKGIGLLPNDKWTSHKDLTLRLVVAGVQMELAVGRIGMMEKYSKELLAQPTCSALEKSPVYLAQCYELLSVSLDGPASIKLGIKILRNEFGVWFGGNKVFRPAIALRALFKTIKVVKSKKKDFFENLGEMTDPTHHVIMELIARINYSAYFAKDVFIQILCTIKHVEMTLDHGVGSLGGFPFITLAVLAMAVTKDNEAGAQFTELGFMLQAKSKSERATSAAIFLANQSVYPWIKHPLQNCRRRLLEGYTSGMRAGNSEMGLWCHVTAHVLLSYQVGRPLRSILSKCYAIATQCEQLKLVFQEIIVRLNWQMILILVGDSDEATTLNGHGIDPERLSVEKIDQQYADINVYVFLGDYESGANVALDIGDTYDKTYANNPQVMTINFLRGVALYAMARRTRKRKYLRPAKRVSAKIGGWLKAGNPNVCHFYPLLRAEQAAMDGKHQEAKKLYHEAIVLSARTGHIQYAALANERFADFCRHDLGDEDEATFRIGEAIQYYKEWGADAKVEKLKSW